MIGTEVLLNIASMVVSLSVLLISSYVAIDNVVKISEITGLGRSRIGFTFVATATSLPELAIAFFASISGETAVSIGNILGSNVANICLIIGFGVVLYFLKLRKPAIVKFKLEEFDLMYLGIFTASIIPILLISFLPASQIVGLLLIIIYVYQNFKIISKRELSVEESNKPVDTTISNKRALILYTVLALIGITGTILSSDFLVESTARIALFIGIPSSIISATIIAVGTSFPELFLSIQAMLKEYVTLTFGNIIGSCFTNITLILGTTFLFSPMRINIKVFSNLITFSILANLILWYFMHKGNLGLREGLCLLLLYTLFLMSIMGLLVIPE